MRRVARGSRYRMSDADHRDSDRREDRKRKLISQEAAELFARMQDPHVSLDDRRRFVRWLKQSPSHVAEYLRVADLAGDLRRAHLSMVFADESASNVIDLFDDASRRATARTRLAPLRWKAAAAIAACALAALLFLVARTVWYEHQIETDLGEWKTATLADGSELLLGPNTLLTLDLSDSQRSIAIMRGESYFKVAQDAARPFLVEANAYSVRAVGTEFAVSRRKAEVIVTVSEGQVRVARSATPRSNSDLAPELSVPITADYQLRIADTWPVLPTRIDVRYALAWRDRQLMFHAGDTLADAVQEFNLRNRVQLQLDPRVAALPVRGSFDASDPAAFALTVDKTSPVAVQKLANAKLLIRAE
jgi:transmembrane sensor